MSFDPTQERKVLSAEEVREIFEVIDRLHQARIYPLFCDPKYPACGCDRIQGGQRCEELRALGKPYPVAQCILEEKNGERGGGLFLRVQRYLGLLQTIIHYGIFVGKDYVFKNLNERKDGPWLEIPWLRATPTADGSQLDRKRQKRVEEFLIRYRQERHKTEFLDLLESKSGLELLGPTHPKAPSRMLDGQSVALPLLTDRGKEDHLIFVPDGEQSFFSLLWVLAEASAHAAMVALDVRDWINDATGVLSLNSVPLDVKPDCSSSDVDDEVWEAKPFVKAAAELGLLRESDGPEGWVLTRRFREMCDWLKKSVGGNGPALSTPVYKGDMETTLDGLLQKSVLVLEVAEPENCAGAVREFAVALVEDVAGWSFAGRDSKRRGLLESAKALAEFPARRFNIAGEYRLRRHEWISRNYFATALIYLTDEFHDRPKAGAFALGTLLDANTYGEAIRIMRPLRALLRTLATFGTEFAVRQLLEVQRKAEESKARLSLMRSFAHEVKHIATALSVRWLAKIKVQGEERTDLLNRLGDEAWAKEDWRIAPFPQLIEATGKLIKLWCQYEDPKDVFHRPLPKTMEELLKACWKLAVDTITPRACKQYGFDVATTEQSNDQVKRIRQILDWTPQLWGEKRLKIVVCQEHAQCPVPRPDWEVDSRGKWMDLVRFLVSTMLNCIRHGCFSGDVAVQVRSENSDVVFTISNRIRTDKELPSYIPFQVREALKQAIKDVATTPTRSIAKGIEVQDEHATALNGKVRFRGKQNGHFVVELTVPRGVLAPPPR